MEEETRKRLGIALAILGFVIMSIKGASVVGHYLVGWSIPSGTAVGITVGIVFLTLGLMTANKKRRTIKNI